MAVVGTGGVLDRFGQEVTVEDPATVRGWDLAIREVLDYRGDPDVRLMELTAVDQAFMMGLVVTLAGSVLSGDDPRSPTLRNALRELQSRCDGATARERDHAAAVAYLVDGEFSRSAARWEAVAETHPHDVVATRVAHDVHLHIGDDDGRLRASTAVLDRLAPADPGYGVAAGQHAFALEEVGRLEEAEWFGHCALEVDPVDVWAIHALAHVYETRDLREEAVAFLRETRSAWIERDHLALHLEWHLALRLLASGEFDECLALVDGRLATTDRAFGLADLTSLLWRLELAGCDVGDRWPGMAAKWQIHGQLHTAGFLDLHAALAFSACPDDPGAEAFWIGLETCHRDETSQNARIFDEVVRPLAVAIRHHRSGCHTEAVEVFTKLAGAIHRVGGSHAQRDLFARTADASQNLVEPSMTEKPS